jgi:hypothetical protein
MIEVRKELSSLIKTCEAAAQSHIADARQSYTEFQRSFHEQRAAEALQRAHHYRHELQHFSHDGESNQQTP